jgi:hypothetical protein
MIKILKLQTGEELVADMTMETASIKLVQPFILTMSPNREPGFEKEMTLALFPYAPYVVKHTIEVDASKVIWIAELPNSMIADYNRALENLNVTLSNIKQDLDTKA